MSAPTNIKSQAARSRRTTFRRGRRITYYNPMEEREADKAPLQLALIRRIFALHPTLTRAGATGFSC